MCWLFKLSGAILILSIVKKSFCDIPTCDYFDTVDISHLKRVNDSYMYKGTEIPANLTGDYNYRKLIYDDTEPVKNHLRACICKYRPCVRICCPRKNMLANEKCNDDLPEEIILSMLNLTLENIYKGELWRPATPISAEFLVLRNQFHSYEEMINLREDEYSMLKDGTLIIKTLPIVLYKEQYCLYPQFNADFPKSISIVKHSRGFKLPPGITEVTVVSLICYVLTILVYLYVNKQRNVLGKCFISCLCGMIMNGFTFILDKLSLLHKICALAGYSRYFFLMASFLWVSMISFHLRKILTSKDRSENRNQFLKYSIIVWGIAALATGVIFGMNQVWEQDVHKWSWMPLVGYSECAVKASGPSSWFYLNGPILILNTFSVVMYILIHIWRTKTELKRFQKGGKRITSCFDFDTETNLMLLRLSVLIEVFWILDFMFSYVDIHSIAGLFHSLPIYFHHSFGILVFIMIILN